MAIRRITLSDIQIGQPLPWDIFCTSSAARPLLEKGAVVAPGQLDRWLASGLYADADAPSSVLHSLNQINRRLERILLGLREHGDADTELRSLTQQLIATLERGRDIALAAILLNQIAGAYAVRHCTETAIVVGLIARAMGKEPAEVLLVTAAALTMNVGMVRQADLFQAREGALSGEERAMLRRHPIDSVELLRRAGVTDEQWLELVLLHHETDEGAGHANGQPGSDFSRNAKLIALADRYCALVSARNYRCSLLPPEALARLAAESRSLLDSAILRFFKDEIGPYPPGTLVRLENGETGVVSGRGERAGAIKLHVLRGADGGPVPLAQLHLTSEPGCAIAQALHEDAARLRFTMKHIWGELAAFS